MCPPHLTIIWRRSAPYAVATLDNRYAKPHNMQCERLTDRDAPAVSPVLALVRSCIANILRIPPQVRILPPVLNGV